MERFYITAKEISGTCRADRRMVVEPCVERGGYAILDPLQFIATRLFQFLGDYIDPRYTRRWVLNKLRENGFYSLTVNNPSVGIRVEQVVLRVDNDTGTFMAGIRGNVTIQKIYEVQKIDDRQLGYLVCEHIVHPFDGVPMVARVYRPIFTQLKNANRYRQSESRDYECRFGDEDSGWQVLPVDADCMQQDPWYQANIKAATDISMYHLEREEFRYIHDIDELQARIREAAYDDLLSDEKASINHDIYMAIREFLTDKIRESLDESLDDLADQPEEIEGIANSAIVAAFANAATKAEFDAVSEALADWKYRVEGVNDIVYNSHPDEGYLLVSRDGTIIWRKDVFFVNEWEGNRGNPWFGKFLPNVCEPLPCVVGFEPEDFVERLPTDVELEVLERAYQAFMREKRAAHQEMKFEDCEDDMGTKIPCCIGDWYPDGLDRDTDYQNVFFPVKYGNHVFNEDECRRLLSGEEIQVDGFQTKSGLTVSVRGRLLDRTNQFSQYRDIQFVRTDIHNNVRRSAARSLGLSIDEGLPDDPTSTNMGI